MQIAEAGSRTAVSQIVCIVAGREVSRRAVFEPCRRKLEIRKEAGGLLIRQSGRRESWRFRLLKLTNRGGPIVAVVGAAFG